MYTYIITKCLCTVQRICGIRDLNDVRGVLGATLISYRKKKRKNFSPSWKRRGCSSRGKGVLVETLMIRLHLIKIRILTFYDKQIQKMFFHSSLDLKL